MAKSTGILVGGQRRRAYAIDLVVRDSRNPDDGKPRFGVNKRRSTARIGTYDDQLVWLLRVYLGFHFGVAPRFGAESRSRRAYHFGFSRAARGFRLGVRHLASIHMVRVASSRLIMVAAWLSRVPLASDGWLDAGHRNNNSL